MQLISSKISLFIVGLLLFWVSSNLNFGKEHWRGVLESDAKGYYAYLPATFIYKDLNFGFFDSIEKNKYYDKNFFYDYRSYHNGKVIDKYYCGTAILEMPFFFAAHAVSKCSNVAADGFSKYYCLAINFSAIFYSLFGLFFLGKLLDFYKISEVNKSIVFLAITFGTNLFYYVVVEPGMSHVYSFALVSCFLYQAKKYIESFSLKRFFYMSILLGIIFLVRPLNLLILFAFPFLAGTKESLFLAFAAILKKIKWTFAALIVFLIISSIQLIIYKIASGSFFVYSYTGEGFDFSSPHMVDILFSYRKGLFLYTPLYLLSLGGIYYFIKRSKWESIWVTILFFGLTYVFSCWHSWWYGGSFSSRVYIEFLPLFAISFAIFLTEIKTLGKKIFLCLTFLLIIFNQIQTYQYRYNQIQWDGMTKEKYWDNFLRLDKLLSK